MKHFDQYVEKKCYFSTWRTWYNTNSWQVVSNCSSEERHNIDNTSNLVASIIVQWNRTDFVVNRSCRDCSFDEDDDDTFRTCSTRVLRSMFRNNRSFARDYQIIDETNRTRQHFQWRLSRAVLMQTYFQICQLCSKNLVQTCDERNDKNSIHSWLKQNEHFCENNCKLHCRSLAFQSDFDWHKNMSIFDAKRHHQLFDHQFEMWCQSSHVILTRLSIFHAFFHQSQSLNQSLTFETSFFTCHTTRFMIAHFWINVCWFYFEFEHNHSFIFFLVEHNLFKMIHVLFSSFYTRKKLMTFWWTTFLNRMMKSINVSLYSLFSSLFTCHIIRFMIAHFWTNVCDFFFEFEHDYSSILFFVKFNFFNVIHVLFSSFYIRECVHDVLMINILDSNDEVDRCFFILVVFFALYMSYYLRIASFILFVEWSIVELEAELRISNVKTRRFRFHAWYF